MKNQSQLACYY